MSDQDDKTPTVETRHVPDNILAFNERIKPLMDQIIKICAELDMPMLASFQTHPAQLATAMRIGDGQLVRKPLVEAAILLIEDEDHVLTQIVQVGESGPLGRPGEKAN